MNSSTPNRAVGQIAMRLRLVGKLADQLEAGGDVVFIVDVAKAIVDSCNNLEQGEPE